MGFFGPSDAELTIKIESARKDNDVQAIIGYLAHKSAPVRSAALYALASLAEQSKVTDGKALATAVELLDDRDDSVKLAATELLRMYLAAGLNSERSLQPLNRNLASNNRDVALAAARAVSCLAPVWVTPESIPPLNKLASRDDEELRIAALDAIGRLACYSTCDASSLDVVIAALEFTTDDVVMAALDALESLALMDLVSQEAIPQIMECIPVDDDEMKAAALRALIATSDKMEIDPDSFAFDDFQGLLDSEDGEIRQLAAKAMGMLASQGLYDERFIDGLKSLQGDVDQDEETRDAAREALEAIGEAGGEVGDDDPDGGDNCEDEGDGGSGEAEADNMEHPIVMEIAPGQAFRAGEWNRLELAVTRKKDWPITLKRVALAGPVELKQPSTLPRFDPGAVRVAVLAGFFAEKPGKVPVECKVVYNDVTEERTMKMDLFPEVNQSRDAEARTGMPGQIIIHGNVGEISTHKKIVNKSSTTTTTIQDSVLTRSSIVSGPASDGSEPPPPGDEDEPGETRPDPFEDYENALRDALSDGELTGDESAYLAFLRKKLGITMDQHRMAENMVRRDMARRGK